MSYLDSYQKRGISFQRHKLFYTTLEVKADTKSKFQTFLERKKIYFETVMMLALSIAGVIVSIVSVKVAMVANDISLNEQRIEDLEKQPAFILDIEADEDKMKYVITTFYVFLLKSVPQSICKFIITSNSIFSKYNYKSKYKTKTEITQETYI